MLFSTREKLNDPFDCNLTYEIHTGAEIQNIKKVFGKIFIDFGAEGIDGIVERYLKNPPLFEKSIKENIDDTFKYNGLCCFCKNNENILMWSHYADNHRGVCLEFDTDRDEELFKNPLLVKYEKDIPEFNYFNHYENIRDFMLGIKYIKWDYEEEVRINVNVENGNLIKFKKQSLSGIYFGLNCENIHQKEIKNILSQKGYSNTLLYGTQKMQRKFKVDYFPLLT
ncbi:MAG: DUF2971 domain-containing protein [Bacteroidetes bacterium]|nr:DUF2971 domain-containing protein [Bacteroidota bacterium]